jgi:hypothetical protein
VQRLISDIPEMEIAIHPFFSIFVLKRARSKNKRGQRDSIPRRAASATRRPTGLSFVRFTKRANMLL